MTFTAVFAAGEEDIYDRAEADGWDITCLGTYFPQPWIFVKGDKTVFLLEHEDGTQQVYNAIPCRALESFVNGDAER